MWAMGEETPGSGRLAFAVVAIALAAAASIAWPATTRRPPTAKLQLDLLSTTALPAAFVPAGADCGRSGQEVLWGLDGRELVLVSGQRTRRLQVQSPVVGVGDSDVDSVLQAVAAQPLRIIQLELVGRTAVLDHGRALAGLAGHSVISAVRTDLGWVLLSYRAASAGASARWAFVTLYPPTKVEGDPIDSLPLAGGPGGPQMTGSLVRSGAAKVVVTLSVPPYRTVVYDLSRRTRLEFAEPDWSRLGVDVVFPQEPFLAPLATLPLDVGFLQLVGDLRGERRILVRYDSAARPVRALPLEAASGLVCAHAASRRLTFIQGLSGRRHLARYGWHWERGE